jgi:hypothetical protein
VKPCRNETVFCCKFHDSEWFLAADMSEIVIVTVAQGKLRGREATTKSGATYYSFQGIPYAKPPVGSLRFKVRRNVLVLLSEAQLRPWFKIMRDTVILLQKHRVACPCINYTVSMKPQQ